MQLRTAYVAESTSGAINDYGWWKIERQTATVITNILNINEILSV